MVDKEYDRNQRDPVIRKKYGNNWRRLRNRYMSKHPLCERCLQEGRMTPATECHHVLPLKDGGLNVESNLMALCQSCHKKIHIERGDRRVF